MKEATRFLVAFFLFPRLVCFPRSAELADVRDLGKEAALYHFTCRFNPLHLDSVIVVVVAVVVVVVVVVVAVVAGRGGGGVGVVVVLVDDLNSEEGQLFTCVSKIFSLAPPDLP